MSPVHVKGWLDSLEKNHLEQMLYLQRRARSRSFIRWCCNFFRTQVKNGRRAVLEHPTGAEIWTYPEVLTLLRQYTSPPSCINAAMGWAFQKVTS